ncbi:hypothetical protein F4859DRAFT_140211 [Xylaria cf. heliscus]|nr:hypothetical protein F4859DRAFT_140211 [Xylaria cf. heliscus]
MLGKGTEEKKLTRPSCWIYYLTKNSAASRHPCCLYLSIYLSIFSYLPFILFCYFNSYRSLYALVCKEGKMDGGIVMICFTYCMLAASSCSFLYLGIVD